MKKNGNKWIAIILVVMVVFGIIMNQRGSAKEVKEPEKERVIVMYIMHEDEDFDEIENFLIDGLHIRDLEVDMKIIHNEYRIVHLSNDEYEISLEFGYPMD